MQTMQKTLPIKSMHYKIFTIFIVVFFSFALTSCSNSSTPKDFYRIRGLKVDDNAVKINSIRLDALKQSSRGLGAQAGLSWRSQQINKILESQKHQLDQIFNFNYLILKHNVLPPVLVEGDNTLNLASSDSIRIADRDYQIAASPRFVTAPPNWRSYIWMNYKKPEIPNNTLLPKDSKESKIWDQYTRFGWNEGANQADEIFAVNLARLERDFNGMLLYRKLLVQNMISAPFVSQASLGVTGGGATMRINDRVLRITSFPELKPNIKVWSPALVKKPNDDEPVIKSVNYDKLGGK